MKHRRMLPALVAGALLAVASIAPASSSAFVVGVGDQNPAFFTNEHLQALGSKRTRLIVAYDAVLKPSQREHLDAWMSAAREAGQEILVAFNPPEGMQCPNVNGRRTCTLAPTARYRKAFQAFRARYPYVRLIQPWNEVNNLTQPTAHRPDAVVRYYKIVRSVCRSCKVVGADIQDLPNMVRYTRRLLAEFRRQRVPTPKLWGLHNYTDVNRFVKDRNSSLRKFVRLVPGKVWLTETGGIYRFQPQNARQTFRPDLRRQKRAMETLFTYVKRYQRKVKRVYLYNWLAPDASNRWDSAVLDVAGAPRPVYDVLVRHRRYFR